MCSVVSDSLQTHGLQLARLLCSWNSPGKNTGAGSHSILQGIVSTQEPNPASLVSCIARQTLPLVPPGNWVLHGSLKYSLLWIERQPGGEETTEAQLWVSDGLNVPLFSPKCCQAYPPSTMPTAGNVRQGGNRKREGKGSRYRLQNSFQFKFHIFYLKVRDRKLMKDCLNYLVKLKLYRHRVEMFAYRFWYI